MTIANGDEVGVLVPEDLEPIAKAGGEDIEDLHRTIIAALLAQVPENEISLNAAAKRLAWSGHTRFERYRETDDKGSQRASRPFREIILAACERRLSIVARRQVARVHLRSPAQARHAEAVRAARLSRRSGLCKNPNSWRKHDCLEPSVDGRQTRSTPGNPPMWTCGVDERPHSF